MLDVIRQASGRLALARWEDDGGAHKREANALPEPVIELARRLGNTKASVAKLVSLTHTGDMRMGQGTRKTRFRTRLAIDIAETSFTWREKAGPFGAISVCDDYCKGAGTLDVKAFGLKRAGHIDGPAIAKGEIMRYLVDLTCMPFAAEVGWCDDGQGLNYCRGTLSSWDVA